MLDREESDQIVSSALCGSSSRNCGYPQPGGPSLRSEHHGLRLAPTGGHGKTANASVARDTEVQTLAVPEIGKPWGVLSDPRVSTLPCSPLSQNLKQPEEQYRRAFARLQIVQCDGVLGGRVTGQTVDLVRFSEDLGDCTLEPAIAGR